MGKHLTSFEQKVVWLVNHPGVWRGWPGDEHMDSRIKEAMRKDGIISAKAHNYDIADFGKLIAEARARLRKLQSQGHMIDYGIT